jgi:hypothetical protein
VRSGEEASLVAERKSESTLTYREHLWFRIVGEGVSPLVKSRGHGVLEHFQGCMRVIRSRTCSALVLKVCLLGGVT